jgi:hypothetical protein
VIPQPTGATALGHGSIVLIPERHLRGMSAGLDQWASLLFAHWQPLCSPAHSVGLVGPEWNSAHVTSCCERSIGGSQERTSRALMICSRTPASGC